MRNVQRILEEIVSLDREIEMLKLPELKESEIFQSILDCMGDAVVVAGKSGNILLLNPAAKKLLNARETDATIDSLAQHHSFYLPDQKTPFPKEKYPIIRAMHGESIDRELIFMTGPDKKGVGDTSQNLDQSPTDIEGIWLSVTARPLAGKDGAQLGAVAVLHDITERVKKQAMYQKFLESAPDAMVIVNPKGEIVYVNSQAEKFFGYKPEELIGKTVEILVPERFRAKHVGQRSDYAAHPRVRPMGAGYDLRALRKDGTEFPVEISLSPVETPEGTLFASAIRDVTDRKLIENQLKTFADKLTESNRELSDFTSIVSHDLQEPLRKVQAFGERLKTKHGGTLSEEAVDYLERMVKAASRMQDLINDLLVLSRVSTKDRTAVSVDLADVIHEVKSDLEVQIEQTKAELETGNLPTIEGDPTQLKELFQNLISNALKFRRKEEPPHVKIEAVVENGNYEISIEDNGIGFDEKYLDRIFGIFQRLHSKSEYEGTGIGLAICKKIAERHGGNITATSQPGQGAKFVVTLPITQRARQT